MCKPVCCYHPLHAEPDLSIVALQMTMLEVLPTDTLGEVQLAVERQLGILPEQQRFLVVGVPWTAGHCSCWLLCKYAAVTWMQQALPLVQHHLAACDRSPGSCARGAEQPPAGVMGLVTNTVLLHSISGAKAAVTLAAWASCGIVGRLRGTLAYPITVRRKNGSCTTLTVVRQPCPASRDILAATAPAKQHPGATCSTQVHFQALHRVPG